MIICPKCNSDHTWRIHRTWWMRFVARSICVRCSNCGTVSLIRDALPLKPEPGSLPQRRTEDTRARLSAQPH